MVQKLLIILSLIFISSCAVEDRAAKTWYQKKNMAKFQRPRYLMFGGKRRPVRITHRGSFRHPAVPDFVRKDIKSRAWTKNTGQGKIE